MNCPFDFSEFFRTLPENGMESWRQHFLDVIDRAVSRPDGNFPQWLEALKMIPEIPSGLVALDRDAVSAFPADALTPELAARVEEGLLRLSPWRKGPFRLGDVFIDAEWRCDMKWNRVIRHLSPLAGRRVLDVGCGNGYYLFRMAGCGARAVIGIDTSLLFMSQFAALQRFIGQKNVTMLPVGFEDMPADMEVFDTVFAMGVFYHRRSPFDFLRSLKGLLKKGGELVLETLIIEGDQRQVLVPPGRYARMNNVWFIPSPAAMILWLEKAGFADARMVDRCRTTVEEQRATRWMPGDSFARCVLPENPELTVEGLPAPVRAVFVARCP